MPTLNISGTLKDSAGNPISGRVVKIYIKPSNQPNYPTTPALELSTNTNGNFSGSKTVDPNTYDVLGTFEGDAMYKPSSSEVKNIDARVSTTLTINVSVS